MTDPATPKPKPSAKAAAKPAKAAPKAGRFADRIPIAPVPTLADWRAGGDRQKAFRKYWTKEFPGDLADYAVFGLFRILPLRLASAFGGWLGRRSARRVIETKAPALARYRANLAHIRPDIPDSELAAIVTRSREVFGRMYAETAQQVRLARRHVTVIGEHHMTPVPGEPLVIIGVHTGNWEVASAKSVERGYRLASFIDPPPKRSRRRIITWVRDAIGHVMLMPNAQGLRDAMAILREGGNVVFFCDELDADGRCRGPLFGRPPTLDGNMAFAARLARKTNARVVVFHVRRGKGIDLTLEVGPRIHLDPGPATDEQLLRDVATINAAIEPIVRANVDQWYWLDNRMA